MNTVLVVTQADDHHAAAVAWALERLGAVAQILTTDDLLDRHRISLHVKSGVSEVVVDDLTLGPAVTTWLRRPHVPRFSALAEVHPEDREYATIVSGRHYSEFLSLVSETGFCVDPYFIQKRADNKSLQQVLAHKAGFNTAPALFTNDPDLAINFAKAERSVLKSLRPFDWPSATGVRNTPTVAISAEKLQDGRSTIAPCPIMLQQLLPSDDELRVTCIGKNLFAASLGWTNQDGVRLDWRNSVRSLSAEAIELPGAICDQLLALMQAFNLRYGAIDLIRRGEDYYFLEVNPLGQWSWLDSPERGLPLLDCMAQYLAAGDDRFIYEATTKVSMADFARARAGSSVAA